MEAITIVLISAVIVEAILQVIKTWMPEGKKVPTWFWAACGAVIGIGFCVLGGIDVVSAAGVTLAVPVAGQILTGIIISRGASFVHDLWVRVKEGLTVDNSPEKQPK